MSNDMTPFDGYGNDLAVTNSTGTGALERPGGRGAAARDADAPPAPPPARAVLDRDHAGAASWAQAGGYIGYTKLHPVYPRRRNAANLAEQARTRWGRATRLPNWEEYVQSQTIVLGSRMVIGQAMARPELEGHAAGR